MIVVASNNCVVLECHDVLLEVSKQTKSMPQLYNANQDDDVQMAIAHEEKESLCDQDENDDAQTSSAYEESESSEECANPLVYSSADVSNSNQAKPCFKCIETFVQESAFYNHLINFHGLKIRKIQSASQASAN